MRRNPLIRLASLLAVAILGLLAANVRNISADNDICQAKIAVFAIVASVQRPSGPAYEIRTVINVTADNQHQDVAGWSDLTGPAGDYIGLNARNLRVGRNEYVRWIGPEDGSSPGEYETETFSLECDGDTALGGTSSLSATATAKARVYKPGQAQPLVQPWANGCPDELVIDSRGSDETKGTISPPGAGFLNELRLQKLQNLLVGNFVIGSLANPYPAAGGKRAFLEAWLKLPGAYHRSLVKGKAWLRRELGELQRHCTETKVYLTGYSQGAQVTGDVYQERFWPQVVGVALFGDPSFNPRDSSAEGNFNSSEGGILHRRRPFNSPRVVTVCHRHDPVCQGKKELFNFFTYHNNYGAQGDGERAAGQLGG